MRNVPSLSASGSSFYQRRERWCTGKSRQVVEKAMKILRLLHFCCSVPASGAELEREKSELFWPRDCHKFPPALQQAVMLGCAGDVAFPTSSSSKQQLSCCPLQQEHQTRLFTALFPFPFLPGFQPHLSFQARGASPWHGLLYG